jgi:hypothetical protein
MTETCINVLVAIILRSDLKRNMEIPRNESGLKAVGRNYLTEKGANGFLLCKRYELTDSIKCLIYLKQLSKEHLEENVS